MGMLSGMCRREMLTENASTKSPFARVISIGGLSDWIIDKDFSDKTCWVTQFVVRTIRESEFVNEQVLYTRCTRVLLLGNHMGWKTYIWNLCKCIWCIYEVKSYCYFLIKSFPLDWLITLFQHSLCHFLRDQSNFPAVMWKGDVDVIS